MSKPVFWREDPVWDRLNRQLSWAALMHAMSLEQGVSVSVQWSHVGRKYHCELHVMDAIRSGYARRFVSEGWGAHPLGAVRSALEMIVTVKPRVRSLLLEALLDYLREEIDRHGMRDTILGWAGAEG